MIRPLLALLVATPAVAAERTIPVGSFDRVRVEGAFEVRIATGGSPGARIAGDVRALDPVEVRVDGTTLTLRRRGGIRTTPAPVVATLSAPSLRAVTVIGGGSVTASGMRTERADLSVAGGRIAVTGLAAEQADASVIGEGSIALAGRAAHVRLGVNGSGAIDAAKLDTDELAVRLDGPGAVLAAARYTAAVASAGSGRVVVTGKPKCTVRAPTGSDVTCGAPYR